jgi:membrane-bound metal-dependent hydrolase YbcI (DUF457 family)
MDSITQSLLGAVVAQAGFRRTLGGRAVVAGAVLGAVPDLDVVAGLFGPYANWLHHRGVTHSIFFGPIAGPLFGWGLWCFFRWRAPRRGEPETRSSPEQLRAWIWLSIFALFTHPLIDLFTSYGTQLLAPYYSVLAGGRIDWSTYPIRHDLLIDRVAATPEAGIFNWFAMGKLWWQVVEQPDGAAEAAVVEAVDYRYGMMGGADMGFWGIRARIDRDGKILGHPESFQRPRSAIGPQWREYWRRIWG